MMITTEPPSLSHTDDYEDDDNKDDDDDDYGDDGDDANDYQWTAQPATYCAAELAMIVSAQTGRYLHIFVIVIIIIMKKAKDDENLKAATIVLVVDNCIAWKDKFVDYICSCEKRWWK